MNEINNISTQLPKYVTQVELQGDADYGLFKVKGLEKTIFRYQDDGETIKVVNGVAFLRDTPESNNGKQIDLQITQERLEQYERDIAFLISLGKTGPLFS